jgi:hypothetical protein
MFILVYVDNIVVVCSK